MEKLTPKQMRRAMQLDFLLKSGDIAILHYIAELEDEIESGSQKMASAISSIESTMRGIVSKEEIESVVEALIPEVRHGKTPSAEEIRAIFASEMASIRSESGGALRTAESAARSVDSLSYDVRGMLRNVDSIAERAAALAESSLEGMIPTALEIARIVESMTASIARKMSSLPDEEKLSIDSVKGLPEALQGLLERASGKNERSPATTFVGGPGGLFAYVNGLKKGVQKAINFKAGTGVTLAWSLVNGLPTLTISSTGSGGALAILDVQTGSVDDSNVAFTFLSKPVQIFVNGQGWRDGSTVGGAAAWTWDEPTLTATLAFPVGAGGDIYGTA